MDDGRRLVPAGEIGELYIGGEGLARGYLNQAELTTECFIPDPFSKKANDRLYRSGDFVRLQADGDLEYVGRTDDQVKIRGYRIELGEIENAMENISGVVRAVVVTRPDSRKEKRICGYWVGTLETQTLQRALRKKLPEYMVPSHLIRLDSIPLNPNGKIDRDMLPEPQPCTNEYISPSTAIEVTLAGFLEKIIGLPRIGLEDKFFDMGGDSLKAVRLIALIKTHLGIDLGVGVVLGNASLERACAAGHALPGIHCRA